MSMAEVKIKQWGNSFGVLLPKDLVQHENLKKGDIVKLDIVSSKRIDGFGIFKGSSRFMEEPEHEDL